MNKKTKQEQEDYDEFERMMFEHETHVIEQYKEEQQTKAKNIFTKALYFINYFLYLVVAGATFIFIGVLYMAFYQTGTLEVLKIWFIPLIMSGLASFLMASYFAGLVGKDEE